MAFQGFALFALSAFGLASLLYYIYANNAAQEQEYGSGSYEILSPDFSNWSSDINTDHQRTSNNERSSSNRRKRQSKKSQSNQLPEIVCTICLQKIKDKGKTLPCNHRFHDECIEDWKSQGPTITRYTCPNCRKSYVSKPVI